ncbi:bifunctional folylpolyglutamate synthase/dihydrofolate synthase [Knoellia koreensis]|jgi:dihydrofolate synthase/folylpolyglutamate synthase|uniref:tetrahydrofolate synthase n=1 Tax=Knoellia koreensis TaxID=2730921 RepID=A0A849HHE4_9MICO|nr:folylpolyglutamate synthase/dihydrofolate synthase family protein [Knoellia sp. DB2414S]NNM46063.1 bifunctional folylpolyglutamate synthase/dihydrofolate synthase [Knoellia sp. DB2414S]
MAGSGRPDAAQREAARNLELTKRMREVEQAIDARAPESDVEPSLDQIRAVMELLGDPQRTFPVIHVTGTNGKTSTSRIIESILLEMGLRTGRFTSPHLHSMRERIVLSGKPISEDKFVAAYDDVIPFVEIVDAQSAEQGLPRMNYFQTLVAVAYAAFADAPVDVAIVEVGLGGAWDATNVADGQVAVVTPVDLDHMHLLGDTVEEIATEKSGIIKEGALAVSSVQPYEDVLEILRERSVEVGARLAVEGFDFGIRSSELAVGGQQFSMQGLAGEYDELFLPLFGAHQLQNAVTAVAAVEAFVGGGEQRLDPEVLRAGLASAKSPGRLEIVRRSPTVVVDAAHNPAGAMALRRAIEESFNFTRLVGVVAILKDKSATEILEVLEPVLDHVVVTRTTSPRATRPAELGEIATDIFGEDRVSVVEDLPDALDIAAGLADEGGVAGAVLATGSVTTAAEVRMLLGTTDV